VNALVGVDINSYYLVPVVPGSMFEIHWTVLVQVVAKRTSVWNADKVVENILHYYFLTIIHMVD
jgi:hypothetical protein